MWLLRTLMLVTLIVWIGGIIFFAFIVAPTLFTVLPSTKLAGDVVSVALSKLHWMGLISGALFLICSVLYDWHKYARRRLFTTTHMLIVLMLALTAISQFAIAPRMRELRSTPQSLDALSARTEFDRLHAWSTRAESAVLVVGLGVIILVSKQWDRSR